MIRYILLGVIFILMNGLAYGQYNLKWSSGNLGQYGWGGAYGFDIDNDGLVEFEVRRSQQYTFYNGDYTVAWAISFPGYDYTGVARPRDTDGDGLLVPLNTDDDPAGELVALCYYYSGAAYYGRFRVYDAVRRNLEFESPLITGFYGSATIEDINGDNRDEIIINRFGSAATETYVDVYGYQTGIGGQKGSYQILSSSRVFPNPVSGEVIIPLAITNEDASKSILIEIYDEVGRIVKILMDSKIATQGDYRLVWDGTDNKGLKVNAGTYFIRIIIGEKTETKSVNIIK